MEPEDGEATLKRVPKMTVKAQEERLNQLIGTRRAKLGHLTRQMRKIKALLGDSGNVNNVYECITGEFAQSFDVFQDVNSAAKSESESERVLLAMKVCTVKEFALAGRCIQ